MLNREIGSAPVLLGVDNETYLRRFVLNDAPLVVSIVRKHAEYIGRTEKWAHSIHEQPDRETVMRTLGFPDEDERGEPYALFHRGRFMGGIALHSFAANYAKLGYWRIDHPEVRSKGLVTRAARQVVNTGFTRLGLAAIGIEINADNTPSRHVAERLGAAFVAHSPEGRLVYMLANPDE